MHTKYKTNHKKVKKIITQKDYYVDGLLICLISPCFIDFHTTLTFFKIIESNKV